MSTIDKPPLKIEIIEVKDEYGSWFTVIIGDMFADRLCRDEALGLIAAHLYQSPVKPPWLRTYEAWSLARKRLGMEDEPNPIAALTHRS